MLAPAVPLPRETTGISSGGGAFQSRTGFGGLGLPRDAARAGLDLPGAGRSTTYNNAQQEQQQQQQQQQPSWRIINRLLGQAGFQALPLSGGLQDAPSDAAVRAAFAQVLAEYERRGMLLQSLLSESPPADSRTRVAEAALMEMEQALLKSNRQVAWLKSKLLKYRAYIERKRRERREQQQQQQEQQQQQRQREQPERQSQQEQRVGGSLQPQARAPQREGTIDSQIDWHQELRQLVTDLQIMLQVPDYRLLPERIRQLQREAENAIWLAEFADCVRSIVEEVLGPESHLSEEQVLDELEKWAVERVSAASEPA